MKLRIAITAVATFLALWSMYSCRAITFAIWTLAALIDRKFPITTVATIELIIAAALAVGYWFLVDWAIKQVTALWREYAKG